jgi:hypothetical protein
MLGHDARWSESEPQRTRVSAHAAALLPAVVKVVVQSRAGTQRAVVGSRAGTERASAARQQTTGAGRLSRRALLQTLSMADRREAQQQGANIE